MAAVGCTAANHVSQIDRTSSPRLNAQLLAGSGLRFAAARALARVPCDVSAMLPASSAAPHRHGSGADAAAPNARIAAAGGLINVCTACHTESTNGTLSAKNSTR